MAIQGYLGIDAGTQELTVVFTDEAMQVIASSEGRYEMISGLPEGCYEQRPEDWESALRDATKELRAKLDRDHPGWQVRAIGISAQMHGEVLADAQGRALGPARLWCDARNEDEARELTAQMGVKMPKRLTATRWLWTLRNQPEKASRVANITTPAGWIAYRLTGRWTLGIGDAAGMFPISQHSMNYDERVLARYEEIAPRGAQSIRDLLPHPLVTGEDAGTLTTFGAQMLGLPRGIPLAPAEGDQPAALAGSLIGEAGMISMSLGTSVCANAVGDRPFTGVHPAIDHFCAADGKPINMVWLRNGTTYMNTVMDLLGAAAGGSRSEHFATVMPALLAADPSCGGVAALPFLDDEPGLSVGRGGLALMAGFTSANATPGNVAKAALLSTLFNLRHGIEVLDRQGFPRTELVLSGGLIRTPELAQVVADVMGTPAVMLESATEGCAWGAALLAKYRYRRHAGESRRWSDFLSEHTAGRRRRFTPDPTASARYTRGYERHKRMLALLPALEQAVRE